MSPGDGLRLHSKRPGFTLLELVLVMLVCGMMMALAAPNLRGFLIGRRGSEAAAQIVALAQHARTQAVSTGLTYRFSLDAAARTYGLTVQNGIDFQPLNTEFGRPFRLPDGSTAIWQPSATPGHDYIDFFPDGRIEAATLLLTAPGGQEFEIGCRSETELLSIIQREAR